MERKNYPGLDTNVTHLKDDRCFPGYRDDSKVVFTIGFNDCETEHEDDGENLIYKNRIIAIVRDVDDEESITRTNTRILPFQCSYKKKAVISKKMYSPRLTYVITKTGTYDTKYNLLYRIDEEANLLCDSLLIDFSVLLGMPLLVKFIRNYIRDRSDVFSISTLVSVSMTSFPALHNSVCVQRCQKNVLMCFCLKRKLHVSSKI